MIARLFWEAAELVKECGRIEPAEFWRRAGSQVRWAKHLDLDGKTLFDFSTKIISARRLYQSRTEPFEKFRADYQWVQEKEQEENHRFPRGQELMTDAVDSFVTKLTRRYRDTSRYSCEKNETQNEKRRRILNIYCPNLTNDSDGEVDKEAIVIKYLKGLELTEYENMSIGGAFKKAEEMCGYDEEELSYDDGSSLGER
ncbi:hypothetical protein AAE478_008460 [Parahypoxylon ruwenzoriense]